MSVAEPTITNSCPVCGTELSMAQLFAHEATRGAFERLAAVSIPLGARVLAYITLFAPPKTRLTVPKQVRLILQLLPDLERQALTWRGREWAAPLGVWAQAIDQMLAARDAGRLDLPMKGHAYLHAIVAGIADKTEGATETQANAERFQTARSGPTAPSVIPAKAGIHDPALAKIAADHRNAAPMPAATREKIAELRGATPTQAIPKNPEENPS